MDRTYAAACRRFEKKHLNAFLNDYVLMGCNLLPIVLSTKKMCTPALPVYANL